MSKSVGADQAVPAPHHPRSPAAQENRAAEAPPFASFHQAGWTPEERQAFWERMADSSRYREAEPCPDQPRSGADESEE